MNTENIIILLLILLNSYSVIRLIFAENKLRHKIKGTLIIDTESEGPNSGIARLSLVLDGDPLNLAKDKIATFKIDRNTKLG